MYRCRRPVVAAVAAVIAVVAAQLAGCGTSDPDERRVLRRGTTGEIVTLDPQFSLQNEASSALKDLYEGLVRLDPRGRIQPAVARSWTVSADGLAYTFELREDARWSDGTPLTAADFVFSLRRLVDPATASPHAALLSMVGGASEIIAGKRLPEALAVTARGDHVLEIELDYAAPYLLSVLAHAATAPLHRESIERFDRLFTRPGNLVSNGPYVLAQRLEQQYVELARNPYYGERSPGSIERVRYVPFEEQFAQFTAYRVGQLDLTDTVPASGTGIVRDQFPDEFVLRPTKDTLYYAFNLRQGPLAEAPVLREALSMTIMREAIVSQVTQLDQPPAYSFVPPMFGDYEPPRLPFADLSQQDRDAAARALLAQAAGEPPQELPRLRVLYNTNDMLRRITVAVTSMWRQALGVESELTNQEFGVFLDTLRDPSAWDVARLSWRADFDDPYAFLEIFTTGSPNNFVGFADPVYDDLLERSHREQDPARRFALLRQAEQRLLDANAIAPVFFYVDRILAKPQVEVGDRVTLKPLPTADLRWR